MVRIGWLYFCSVALIADVYYRRCAIIRIGFGLELRVVLPRKFDTPAVRCKHQKLSEEIEGKNRKQDRHSTDYCDEYLFTFSFVERGSLV